MIQPDNPEEPGASEHPAELPAYPYSPMDVPSTNGHAEPGTEDDLSEILAYSCSNVPERGALWLTAEAADKLNKILVAMCLADSWHFREVEPPVTHPPIHKTGPKAESKAKGRSNAGSSKKKRSSATPSKKEEGKERNNGSVIGKTPGSRHDSMSAAQRASRTSQNQLKRLPDWARRLYRVVALLCQSEGCKPFVAEPSSSDPNYAEMCDAVLPVLTPMGLRTIVSKLELGGYQTPLDAFNDVYSTWLCYYRSSTPGSALWLQTYQASRTFLQQIAHLPLKDDFAAAATAGASEEALAEQTARPSQAGGGRRCSANVEQLLQEFLTLHDGKSVQPKRPPSAAKPKPEPSKRKSAAKVVTQHESISEAERQTFQHYLSQLQAKHHLMLFDAFRRTAVWRTLETAEAEVELDDAKTSPPVFRKMIAWCRSQLAVGLPPDKRRKLDTQLPLPSAPPPTSQPAVNQQPAAAGETGSGKFVPSSYDIGGKLAAAAPPRFSASLYGNDEATSRTASSSSSSSTSEDASDSSDESGDDQPVNTYTQAPSNTNTSPYATLPG